MPERVYRDPVHGSIAFDRVDEAYVVDLIDTAEFQRLRRIRQLGAAHLVFQGAEHSRFCHSVGVAHLAKRMFTRLVQDPNFPQGGVDAKDVKRAIVAGALLHDIGHGPFSHLFERAFPHVNHEAKGLEIVGDSGTQIHAALQKHGLVDDVKRIFQKKFTPRFAQDIISSQLDADRLDYLLRDSLMTGVAYGRYDLDWLLEVIELAQMPTNGRGLGLAINIKKGWHAAEHFVIGRYLMYQQVYFHKTIRAAEKMIMLVFQRLVENATQNKFPRFCPDQLHRLLDSDPRQMNLSSYLFLDDEFMITCFNMWGNDAGEDDVVHKLSSRLVHRELFKTAVIDPDKIKDDIRYAASLSELQSEMQAAGFDPRYYLASDSAEDLPYKDMSWFVTKGKAPEDIWLAQSGQMLKNLSSPDVSPLVDSIRNMVVRTRRLCFPREVRALVKKHLQPYLSDALENGVTSKQQELSFIESPAAASPI